MTKIKIDKKEDREQLALILIRNDYTVQIVKEKVGNKTVYFVVYE